MMRYTFSKERFLEELHKCPKVDGVNPYELAEKLAAVNSVGRTKEEGYLRYPYTDEEKRVKQLFTQWLEELGLHVWEDAVGNLFARWEGEDSSAPVVMTGSHIDTVPNGGAFDGTLGCVSSLLAIKGLQNKGVRPKRSIEFVIFTNEEGTRFGYGLFGSKVLMGEVLPEQLHHFVDEKGISMYEAMKQCGFDPEKIPQSKRDPNSIYAFLELHIEQGKQLEETGDKIGIVTGIAGPAWRNFTFLGETDHAGNTPMTMRKDSLAGAAEWIVEVEKLPKQYSSTAVATVGRIQAFPNGTNVIAGKTVVDVDVRDIEKEARDQLLKAITESAKQIAEKRDLELVIRNGIEVDPVPIPVSLQQTIAKAAERHKIPFMYLPSGAGHDAMNIGKYTKAAMIFVPSHAGKSHCPEEWTSLPDCMYGVQILMDTIWEVANE